MLHNFLDIEAKVDELRVKINDEEEIFDVYKKIKIMNYMRNSFLQRLEQNGEAKDQSNNKLRKIKEHFKAVREIEKQFQTQIFEAI